MNKNSDLDLEAWERIFEIEDCILNIPHETHFLNDILLGIQFRNPNR